MIGTLKNFKIHYGNLSKLQKQMVTDKLVFSLKLILNTLENSKKFHELDHDEAATSDECFRLINKLVLSINQILLLFVFKLIKSYLESLFFKRIEKRFYPNSAKSN